MFGGGYFLLQEVKSDEAWMKLEKEFWQYVENVVLHLTNTAKSSNNNLKTDT
jgi:lipopolysaccharide export system protein LptC